MFGKESYLELVKLLATSIHLFSHPNIDIDFLIITENKFIDDIKSIFEDLNLNVNFMIMNLDNLNYALSSRFLIYNYEKINDYNKIVYVDIDILITNNLSILFNLVLENKIYVLREGILSDPFYGKEYFDFTKVDPKTPAFSSGIILFNNCNEVKNLFNEINIFVEDNIKNNGTHSCAYDQAILNYFAITKNIYDNKLLNYYAVNNPASFNTYVINHFPGGVGSFERKYDLMKHFILQCYDNYNYNQFNYKKYNWMHDRKKTNGTLEFLPNGVLMTTWGEGSYTILPNNRIRANWCGDDHLLTFDNSLSTFLSVRRFDYNLSSGNNAY